MIRYFQLTIAVFLISCKPNTQDDLSNWNLENAEIIEHSEKGDIKFQVIFSTLNAAGLNLTDTSVVTQRFVDTLLLDETRYNLKDGDTVKWSHRINTFNSDGLLLEEVDSVDGTLRRHCRHFYENGKLTRSEFLTIIPDHNDMMERVGSDTMKSIVLSFYDKEGKNNSVMALSRNELSFELTGIGKYDTTLTLNQFDRFGNKIQSISIMNGDTTGVTRARYDERGRNIMFTDISREFGITTFRITTREFEYDERGNKAVELMKSGDFGQLIKTEFDEQNRPISRKIYRSGTPANNDY